MNNNILLLITILLPIISGVMIKPLNLEERKKRQTYVASTVIINAIILTYALTMGDTSLTILKISKQIEIYLKVDGVARLFTILASVIWIFATFYSFEYMKHEGMEIKYFTFFLMTLGVIMGIGLSGNIFTLYLFYELMTLITAPLVMHSMTKESISAGVKYIGYSIFGATLSLLSFMIIYNYSSTIEFIPGGVLDMMKVGNNTNLILLTYVLTFIGFGCKAGMFPLHAWLPTAHPVAPAPASAILSGIITKAGVLAIIRVTYYLYGVEFLAGTWAHKLVVSLTLCTIFMGSMLAYGENLLKKRLAYSSVSQVSYVLFGLSLLNINGFIGGILHIVFHALIKNVLFLSAGSIIYMTEKTDVDQLKGIGKSMPITMICFAIASLALTGIPPANGFVSKWYLGVGGVSANNPLGTLGTVTLIISALLTAGYLISIIIDAFFPGADFNYENLKNEDPNMYMTIPMLIMSFACIVFGMFPNRLVDFILDIAKGLF